MTQSQAIPGSRLLSRNPEYVNKRLFFGDRAQGGMYTSELLTSARVYTGRVAICTAAKPCICTAVQMPITNEPHLYSCTSQWSPGRPYIRNRRIEHPEIPDCASRFLPVLAPRPPYPPPDRPRAHSTRHCHTIYSFCQVSAQLQDLSGLARALDGLRGQAAAPTHTTHR